MTTTPPDRSLAGWARIIEQSGQQARQLTDRERMSHAIDDAEKQRCRSLRCIAEQLDLLEMGLHALQHGSLSVTGEYLERAIDALRIELSELRPSP